MYVVRNNQVECKIERYSSRESGRVGSAYNRRNDEDELKAVAP